MRRERGVEGTKVSKKLGTIRNQRPAKIQNNEILMLLCNYQFIAYYDTTANRTQVTNTGSLAQQQI